MLFLRADSSDSSPSASPMTGETGSYTYMAPEVRALAGTCPGMHLTFFSSTCKLLALLFAQCSLTVASHHQ